MTEIIENQTQGKSRRKSQVGVSCVSTLRWIGVMGMAIIVSGAISGCQTSGAKNDGSAITSTETSAPDLYPRWEAKEPIEISRRALDASNETFQTHPDYLALGTPVKFLEPVLKELEKRESVALKTRGEAHVTVVTPPEAKLLTKAAVPMRAIEIAADRLQMGDSDLDPICLGMGQAMLNGKMQRTYFVVLHSENLLRVRREIAHQIKDPTQAASFEADHFYPHVTLGFTFEDLHEEQGVVKDRTSCYYPLKIMP